MTDSPVFIRQVDDSLWHLSLWVQPGAKKTEPMGIFDDRLKLRLKAPAVENKANIALIKYLSKTLGLRQSKISLISGTLSRQKTVQIESDTPPDWGKLL